MIYTRPDFSSIWAYMGAIAQPTTEKIELGYEVEKPPFELANFVENRQDRAIAYILQEGIPEWASDIEYRAGSLSKYNGRIYKALQASTNKQPSDIAFWVQAFEEFGVVAAALEIISKITDQDGFLDFYVRRASPVMTARALGTSFTANTGAPTKTDNDKGFSFKEDLGSGLFKEGSKVVVKNTYETVVEFPLEAIPEDDNTKSVATTAWVKAALNKMYNEIKPKLEIPVGWTVVNSIAANPNTYLGYGTWVQDLQGQALVGVSASTSNEIPEWVKSADKVFGSYEHTLTVDQMPSHKHEVQLGDAITSGESDSISSGGGLLNINDSKSMKKTGGDQPHNNVQPSKTKYIWTRVA